MTPTPEALPLLPADFEAWFASEYPNTEDRQGKFRMSPVRALMAEAYAAGRASLAMGEGEPFGYFKAEPFGWTDCAETDEGAVALYTAQPAPAAPAVPAKLPQGFATSRDGDDWRVTLIFKDGDDAKALAGYMDLQGVPAVNTRTPAAPVSDEQIEAAAIEAVRKGKLSWLGFKEDTQGKYTIPVLSISDYQFARAILALRPAPAQPMSLPPVDGDMLPPIGSKVLIHLASSDSWVEHEVVGYYAWEAINELAKPRHHRLFVRVRDKDGILNARSVCDIRGITAQAGEAS